MKKMLKLPETGTPKSLEEAITQWEESLKGPVEHDLLRLIILDYLNQCFCTAYVKSSDSPEAMKALQELYALIRRK